MARWLLYLAWICLLALPAWSQEASPTSSSSTSPSSSTQTKATSPTPVAVKSVSEIIANWKPENQLYTRGNIGVDSKRLNDLAKWLQQNAPHWLVVLIDDASGEIYRTPNRPFSGIDAVEVQLGTRLNNETDFGKLEHPRTREPDGAVLVFMLKQRRVSYFASDAQDSRNLGESHWQGELDQPALLAMKSGGRVIDAVQNTIKNINQRLEQTIQSDADREAAIALAKQRELSSFQVALAATKSQIEEVESHRDRFKKSYPAATGPLVSPPTQGWRQRIEAFEMDVDTENVRTIQSSFARTKSEMDHYLHSYAEVEGLDANLARYAASIQRLTAANEQKIAPNIVAIEKAIADAKNSAGQGEMDVERHLSELNTLLEKATTELDVVQRAAAQRQAVWEWTRRIAIGMLIALGAGVALFLRFLYQRRIPIMNKAIRELAIREDAVQKETDRTGILFTRTNDLLGSKDRVEKRGYEGKTKELALQILTTIDNLFILSKEMRRVLDLAKSTIHPTSWRDRWKNRFSSELYSEGISYLNGKTLSFQEAHGLPRILRQQTREEHAANAKGEVEITYETAFALFEQQGIEATAMLDRLELALTSAQDQLTQSQNQLDATLELDRSLSENSDGRVLWELPSFLNVAAPKLANELRQIESKAMFDAVSVVEDWLPPIRQKVDSVHAIFNRVKQGCEVQFPAATAEGKSLADLGYRTDWISREFQTIVREWDQRLTSIVAKPSNVAITSSNSPTTAIEADLDGAFQALTQRVIDLSTTAKLVNTLEKDRVPILQEKVHAARGSIALKLGLPLEQIHFGKQSTTDSKFQRVEAELLTAKQLIAKGDQAAANSCVEQATEQLSKIEGATQSALEIVERFPEQFATFRKEVATSLERWTETRTQLEKWQSIYDPSVLQSQPSKPSDAPKQRSRSLDEVLGGAHQRLEFASDIIEQAQAKFKSGQVVQAAEHLLESQGAMAEAKWGIEFVVEFGKRLEQQETRNEKHREELTQWVKVLETNLEDPKASHATIQSIRTLIQSAQASLLEDVSTARKNPIAISRRWQELEERLNQLQSKLVSDRQAHAEAVRAVRGAKEQWNAAWALVQKSQTDGIPDSTATVEANDRIGKLKNAVNALEGTLEKPHGDWKDIDEQAYRLHATIDGAAKTLAGELKDAARVYEVFRRGSQAVFDAENWIGKRGSRVNAHDGTELLEKARKALQRGRYQDVVHFSQSAMEVATAAIQAGERNEQWLEMQHRAEMQKRQRHRRRSNSPFDGNGPSGGGGSFGGGFWPTVIIGGTGWPSSSSSDSWFGGSSGSSGGDGGLFGGGGGFGSGGGIDIGGGGWGGSSDNGSGFSGSSW
ncbi:hypothetical protein VN12_12010 [Pirellula sp. SH-Sr6A]|uniref:hypothetical protein n=1 Tax=Pirellula sp. SH-Sr6A TaxID=1632865 RepID=UPI00078C845B|nr:hypothetical protein [Pirellula sp. SH-Sr6A]AMV32842.1 hypothetical protein VN12_12010 [Pirellula sp. SH-Sr6A]